MSRWTSSQTGEAYQSLRKVLLHGRIPCGQRLGETEWASKLNVHRGALRAALNMLAHEGLVQRGKRGGFFVPAYDSETLMKILEVRAVLEVGALRLADRFGRSGPDVNALSQACDTMQQMIDQEFPLGLAEADRRFHDILIAGSENAHLQRVYDRAPLPLFPPQMTDPESQKPLMQSTMDEHRDICTQIERREFRNAADLLEQHLYTKHATETATYP